MNTTKSNGKYLGLVVGGSLSRGVEVRMDSTAPIEEMVIGRHVVIQGQARQFYGVIVDISLETSDQSLMSDPPDVSDPVISGILSGTSVYASLQVSPKLTIEGVLGASANIAPATTIPQHFSPVYLASEEDVSRVFGSEDHRHFWLGNPLDIDTRVCLDLEEFVKRSNGVFGKSGTGKTFLTRLLLLGILQKNAAVNLVFDMQSEYGWMGTWEGLGEGVKGMKQLFSSQVAVFSLDEKHSLRRKVSPDYLVWIGLNQIEPEDIAMLRETLDLSDVAADYAYSLRSYFGQRWIRKFLDMEGSYMADLARQLDMNHGALSTLRNRLTRLNRFHFITEDESDQSVDEILRYLDRGIHVVLEFGRYQNELAAYMLVANLLTRRIHSRYVSRSEEAAGAGTSGPTPLVITIEEAHRFLSPNIASRTIFGTIAREMRKYNVTLLVVDQRPSGIDDEVMSQLGTKISCLLDNEKDVDSVMQGVAGARELRPVLSRLNNKQQALIFGHSVPMPIVVRIRDFGSPESYTHFGSLEQESATLDSIQRDSNDIFGGPIP